MKKKVLEGEVDLSFWAKEASDGLMFLGTSIKEEKECLRKIQKGIELCEILNKLDLVRENKKIPKMDVETLIAVKRIASNKSLFNYKLFKEAKEKNKEIKNALSKIIKNPKNSHKKLDEYQLFFSRLARVLAGVSS